MPRRLTPTRDDVLEGNDTVTWAKRLESAGITPWLRRHRVALAATTAVLMVAGVATTRVVEMRGQLLGRDQGRRHVRIVKRAKLERTLGALRR